MFTIVGQLGTKMILDKGKQMLYTNVSSISNASVQIIANIQVLTDHSQSAIYEQIDDLDLVPLVSTISAFVKEQEHRVCKLGEAQYNALSFLKDAVLDINKELDTIKLLLIQHKTKWFKQYRECGVELTRLKKLHKRLLKRWELLLHLL